MENTAPAKCRPRIRCWTMLCELTSMKQYSHPASAISAIMRLRRIVSGVVWVEGSVLSCTAYITVEISPTLYPSVRNRLYRSVAVVVLPLVPVMPTRRSFSLG